MHGGKSIVLGAWMLLCFVAAAPQASAQPNPDVIVGSLPDTNAYGTDLGIFAYSVATTSCNIGTSNLNWIASTNQHPVIAQDMWRLKDGRFTQIGSSWLKHGFCALQNPGTCPGCAGGGGCLSFLTPGCADPYSAGLNGEQGNLGPRSQVNAFTGVFPYPYSAPPIPPGQSDIGRRLQVVESDLLPASNPGALYFVTGQYVSQDDATAGNQGNNASYRRITVGATGNHVLSFVGGTIQQSPGIQAWQDFQATVTLVDVQVPGEGLFIAGYDVIDNGNGTWRYEYAVYNMYSDRSARSFSVPVPSGATLTDIGFHDNTWHSGETYSGTDWAVTTTPGVGITWSTDTFATNANANALRWSMMFNFWFTCDAPPTTGTANLGLFKPGTPTEMTFGVAAPSGDFLIGVQNLACVQTSPTSSAVALTWTNGEVYDALTVRRDGAVIANLGGGATGFSDTNPGFGTHDYTVQAEQAGVLSAQVPCSIDVLPAPVSGVTCQQPDPFVATVQLGWANGMAYSAIRVYLDGVLETTLAGSATSFTDTNIPLGLRSYEIAGLVSSVESALAPCVLDVMPPPPLGFTFRAVDTAGTYDLGSGIGQVDVSLTGVEAASNPGYPNDVQGFTIGIVYDPAVLEATSVGEGSALSNPSFFDGQVLTDSVTVGVIIDFFNLVTLDLSAEGELAVASFETNAGNIAGNTGGVVTEIEFQNGLGTGSPIDNLVVVDFDSINPGYDDGNVTLVPGAGEPFRRGDANNDGTIDVADGVSILSYLFQGGPATCLDAHEANDDGTVNIADGVTVLSYLFSLGAAPPSPFPGCGLDPTGDPIDCVSYTGGCP